MSESFKNTRYHTFSPSGAKKPERHPAANFQPPSSLFLGFFITFVGRTINRIYENR